jgi:hypothetical protein
LPTRNTRFLIDGASTVTRIKSINAAEVLDLRGKPTVEAVVTLDNGTDQP